MILSAIKLPLKFEFSLAESCTYTLDQNVTSGRVSTKKHVMICFVCNDISNQILNVWDDYNAFYSILIYKFIGFYTVLSIYMFSKNCTPHDNVNILETPKGLL